LLWSNALASNYCGLHDGSKAGEWRLPNKNELSSLLDYGNYNPTLPSGHPFKNVQSANYWTSTTNSQSTGSAWAVSMKYGMVTPFIISLSTTDGIPGRVTNKTAPYYVWPVRSAPTITTTSGPNGTITPSIPSVTYNSDIFITATPDANYHIAEIKIDGAPVTSGLTSYSHEFTHVTSDHTVAATFAIDTYTLNAAINGTGTITISPSPPLQLPCSDTSCTAVIDSGTSFDLIATPLSGATFLGWSADSNCTTINDTVCSISVMTSNKNVAANFSTVNTAAMVKNVRLNTTYPTLTAALIDVTINPGDELRLRDTQIDGAVTLDRQLTLKGGWVAAFSATSGLPTLLNGALTVTTGNSTMETIDVKGKLSIQSGGSLKVKSVRVRQ
jgi:hypothetical protein